MNWPRLVAILIVIALAPAVRAGQHLVREGHPWDNLSVRAGDEIILMPGRHRPGSLEGLEGTAKQPIVIRSINAKNKAVIQAESFGVQMRNCRFIVFKDVIIEGASIAGIELTNRTALPEPGSVESGYIRVENVTVRNTGPRGLRHGISLMGQNEVEIKDCAIEGWGGAAVEIVASKAVRVQNCTFTGKKEFTQIAGIQVHSRCEDVRISRCRFTDAGDTVFVIGGGTRNETSLPPLPEAKPGTLYEARKVWIESCKIFGGGNTALFAACELATFRNNSIVNPVGRAFTVKRAEADPRLDIANRLHIESNLIVWNLETAAPIVELSSELDRKRLFLGANLWWHENREAREATLETMKAIESFPQIGDVDPRVDEDGRPRNRAAEVYGAFGM